jgi:hypothetical protein
LLQPLSLPTTQEGLQLTHVVLVVWVLLGFVMLNVRWV